MALGRLFFVADSYRRGMSKTLPERANKESSQNSKKKLPC